MNNKTKKLVYAAICLALAMVLPVITGYVPKIGNMLCPMHFPAILCAYICGWEYGAIVGFIAPLLRFAIFGMPPMMPQGISMAFELATYGIVVGILYSILAQNRRNIYVSLITAMVCGRLVWGAARYVLARVMGVEFPFSAFLSGAVLTAIPGMVLQIIIIPLLVMALEKQGIIRNRKN